MIRKNILFVDDNENILSGIRRQLRSYRDQWQLFFANSGSDALTLMEQQNIDLIVSDIMMPEMRGDELLHTVSKRYPATVRIILSGDADAETLKNGLEVAHQYLSKPCNADILRESIAQIFKIQACMSNPLIIAELGNANQLPSLPGIYQDLNTAIQNENITTQEIADILASDMALSAKLLHLVNSPFFGLNRYISNLTDAINFLGLKMLNSLVLSVHFKTAFPINSPKAELFMDYLWLDSLRVSELARLIALSEQQQEDRPDQAYMGGLLHNMGLLIFLSKGGEKLDRFFGQLYSTDQSVAELETAIFGFTRSEAAAYILGLWKIPPRIIESILLQTKPNDTDYDSMNALTAVHAAACLLNPPEQSRYYRLFQINLDSEYLQRIGKVERLPDWQQLANKIKNRSNETRKNRPYSP